MSFTHKIIPNLLTKEECDLILSFSLENLTLNTALTVGHHEPNYDSRKSNVAFYPYYEKFSFISEKISKLIDDNISVKGFDLDYKNSKFQFTEYKIGDYFEWHSDITGDEITQYKRYCSLVIQLNDDYKEGNLEIKLSEDSTMIVEKGIGNTIIFLSDMEHRVTTVENGNRYTLVNWVGLKEKKNYKKTLL
jgi:predicted 2-oxoglutarate/Fe(II)-dependent dioxygenase YbiX